MILQPYILSAILNEPWAINPDAVIGYAPLIANIINQKVDFERGEKEIPFSRLAKPSSDASGSDSTSNKNIAVINITGPLTKNDQHCGPAGMRTIGSWIKVIDSDPHYDGILLVIDSPGGTVAGTETLADIISATKKPIVAFVEDMAASAGYWLASNCDEIIANNTTAQVGSIGVVLSFMDVQPALEKEGVVFHTITAPQSENKTRTFDQLRKGEYTEYKENTLRPLAEKFIKSVKTNRPNAADIHFKADVFFAQDVKGSLIDDIGTFEMAIQRVATLAQLQSHPNSINNMSKPQYSRLAKASGVPALETSDGTINLTAEMAQAVDDALTASDNANATLQQQLTDRANQQSTIDQLNAQITERDNQIAELKKMPGANTATVDTPLGTTPEATDFWSIRTKLQAEFQNV